MLVYLIINLILFIRLKMMTRANNVSSQEGSKGKVEEAFNNMEHEFVTMSCAKGDLEVTHLDPDGHFIELVNHGEKVTQN